MPHKSSAELAAEKERLQHGQKVLEHDPFDALIEMATPKPEPRIPGLSRSLDRFMDAAGAREFQQAYERIRQEEGTLDNTRDMGRFLKERVIPKIPFVSSQWAVMNDRGYRKAKERMEAGQMEPGDPFRILRYEKEQREAGERSWAEQIADAVVPIAGEAYLTKGISLPLSGAGIGARLIAGGAKLATKIAVTPSFYVPAASKRSVEQGGEFFEPKNIILPVIHAAIMTKLLGKLSKPTEAAVGRVPTQIGRKVTQIAAGGVEFSVEMQILNSATHEVDRLLPEAYEFETGKGSIRKLLEGEEGAGKELAIEMITGAVFKAMQAGPERWKRDQAFRKELAAYRDKMAPVFKQDRQLREGLAQQEAKWRGPKDEVYDPFPADKTTAPRLEPVPQEPSVQAEPRPSPAPAVQTSPPSFGPSQPKPAPRPAPAPGPSVTPPKPEIVAPERPQAVESAQVEAIFKEKGLTEREIHVMRNRPPLGGRTHEDIGADPLMRHEGQPVSRERVRQIEADARAKLEIKESLAKIGKEEAPTKIGTKGAKAKRIDAIAGGELIGPDELKTQSTDFEHRKEAKKQLTTEERNARRRDRERDKITEEIIKELKSAKRTGVSSEKVAELEAAYRAVGKEPQGVERWPTAPPAAPEPSPAARSVEPVTSPERQASAQEKSPSLPAEVKALYDRSGDITIPMAEFDAVLGKLAGKSGKELNAVLDALGIKTAKAKTNEKKIVAIESKLKDRRSGAQSAQLIQAEPEATADLLGGKPAEPPKVEPPAIVQKIIKAGDDAGSRLKKKYGGETLFSGFDPTDIPDLAVYLAGKIVKGGYTFAMFAKSATERFGEGIKPHLNDIWARASVIARGKPEPKQEPPTRTLPDQVSIKNVATDVVRERLGMPERPEVDKEGHRWRELAPEADRIAREDPARIDRLIDQLKKDPNKSLTDIEDFLLARRLAETENRYDKAIEDLDSGRGSRDPVVIAKREAAAAFEAGRVAELVKLSERAGTATARGLAARAAELKRDYSPVRALYRGREAKGEDLTVEEARSRTEDAHKIADLQAKVDALEAQIARQPVEKEMGVRPRRQATTRIEVDRAVERFRKAVLSASKSPSLFTTGVPGEVLSAAVDMAKAYARHGVAKFADFVADVQKTIGRPRGAKVQSVLEQAWKSAEAEVEAKRLEGAKGRAHKELGKLAERTATDITKPKRKLIVPDAELTELRVDIKKIKNRMRNQEESWRRSRQPMPQKVFRWAGEVLNLSRSILTTELLPITSAILRQGGFIGFGNPVRAVRGAIDGWHAFWSKDAAMRLHDKLEQRPLAEVYKRNKMLAEVDGALSAQEEAVQSHLAQKIPVLAHSNRSYTANLNRLRADSLDAMAASFAKPDPLQRLFGVKSRQPSNAELDVLANFVNVGSGRGNLGARLETAAVGLAHVFFAPRYVASRFQLLLGQPLWSGTGRTRYLIAKEYAKFAIGIGVFIGLAKLLGGDDVDIEWDPRSTDAAKIRIGRTRLDPWAGLQQVVRTTAQVVTGERKQADGKIADLRGPNRPYRGDTTLDVMSKFGRTKLAPGPGAVIDALVGEDVEGKPATAGSAALKLAIPVPLGYRDVDEALKEHGLSPALAASLLALMGMGVQTYEQREKKKR